MAPKSLTNVPVGAYPVLIASAGAALGAMWYVQRLATRPDIVWDRRNNPHPYLDVKQDETIKMYDSTGTFKRWTRKAI